MLTATCCYPAVESLLQNDDALARYGLAPYLNQLTDRDLAVLLPEIIKAIEEMSPSDEMFADGIRTAGLDLLSRLHIREGMHLCVSTIEFRWGNDFQKRLEYLQRYGVYAKTVLLQLEKKCPMNREKRVKEIDKLIAEIEANKDSLTLVDLRILSKKHRRAGMLRKTRARREECHEKH